MVARPRFRIRRFRNNRISKGNGMSDYKSIVIVDDSLDFLEKLSSSLSAEGFDVRSLQSGSAALSSIQSNPPDLIILDMDIPGTDGFDVCKKLKEHFRTKSIPVIFLTTAAETETRVKGLSLGVADYIFKPFDSKELIARVNTQLQLKRLQNDLECQTVDLLLSNEQLRSEIEERKLTEIALRDKDRQFQAIMDNLQDAYFRTDIKGKIVFMSPSAPLLYGYDSAEEMLGLDVGLLYKNIVDREDIVAQIKASGHVYNRTGEGLKKDGSSFWVSLNAQFYFDENGKVLGTEGFVRDLAECSQAEQQLRMRLAQIDCALVAANAGTWIFEPGNNKFILGMNSCRILGIKADKFASTADIFFSHFSKQDRDTFQRALAKTQRRKHAFA